MKWYTLNTDSKPGRCERKLRRLVKKLHRICRKYGLSYAETYYISSDGTATLNVRAKKDRQHVVNSYTFVR